MQEYSVDISLIEKRIARYRKDHKLKGDLAKALKSLEKDPSVGKLMGGLPSEYHGKVYKIRVGGRSGYRLYYFWEKGTTSVRCFFFISRQEIKNYSQIDWRGLLRNLEPS